MSSALVSSNPFNVLTVDDTIFFKIQKRLKNIYTFNKMQITPVAFPITGAVIIISSNEILKIMLQDIKDSVWGNHEALF